MEVKSSGAWRGQLAYHRWKCSCKRLVLCREPAALTLPEEEEEEEELY